MDSLKPLPPTAQFGDAQNPEKEPGSIQAVSEQEADEATLNARVMDYQLGNPELPVTQFREQIVSAIEQSQATVITAETGAGKSTQIPQFLAEAGYEVIVTQPRVVAARSVAERVRDEVVAQKGESYADYVGYRTARERDDDDANQILFVTDGLQTVRELAGHGVGRKQMLVLDEVHEWNENMEVLVAWAKKRMSEDPNFKVVTMSATMEADKLSRYFADDGKREVPVIEVPGRTFEVKKSEGGDVADEAIKLAKQGKNTLVFVPGKAEIEQVITAVQRANIPGAVVFPLHGQLDANEQRKVFAKYPGAKVIVATNVAQTSITIDDIDAVVDSGLERRNEVKNGVEGLYLRPISQADCLQRAGRAGRTKEGEYVLAHLAGTPVLTYLADREPYGTPEIMRTRLDGMVLRLAKNGFDAAELEFYHQPDHGEIAAAKSRLQKLGALTEDDRITPIGKQMERMPIESHYARMMIEARGYSPEVQAQLAALLATQEVDGITFNGRDSAQAWRKLTSGNSLSDGITQLEVFIAAQHLSAKEQRDHDIIGKNLSKARDVYRQLRKAEKLDDIELSMPTQEEREQLMRCIVAGMVDNLWIYQGGGYENARGDYREPSNRSTVRPGKMIVGMPFDLQISSRRGPITLHLIEGITNVPSVDVLREVAPQLFSEKHTGYGIEDGRVVERCEAVFNGTSTGQIILHEVIPNEQTRNFIVDTLTGYGYGSEKVKALYELQAQLSTLQSLTREQLPSFTTTDIKELLRLEIPIEAISLAEAERYVPELDMAYFMPQEKVDHIQANSPSEINGYALRYSQGVPHIVVPYYATAWADLPESLALPDGREVMASRGYGAFGLLSEFREEGIRQKAEAEKVEAERIAREEQERLARETAEAEAREREVERQVEENFREQVQKVEALFYEFKTDKLPDNLQDSIWKLRNKLAALYNAAEEREVRERRLDSYMADVEVIMEKVKAFMHRYDELQDDIDAQRKRLEELSNEGREGEEVEAVQEELLQLEFLKLPLAEMHQKLNRIKKAIDNLSTPIAQPDDRGGVSYTSLAALQARFGRQY